MVVAISIPQYDILYVRARMYNTMWTKVQCVCVAWRFRRPQLVPERVQQVYAMPCLDPSASACTRKAVVTYTSVPRLRFGAHFADIFGNLKDVVVDDVVGDAPLF